MTENISIAVLHISRLSIYLELKMKSIFYKKFKNKKHFLKKYLKTYD